MNRKYDIAVFIGRMQPLHTGHVPNIQKALELAEQVIVIVGSANQPRTPKNPFTAEERAMMVKEVFPMQRVRVEAVEDFYPDTRWLQNVQNVVHQYCESDNPRIAILGHDKDHTSFYLRMFPTWWFIEIGDHIVYNEVALDATDIRREYFENGLQNIDHKVVPVPVLNFLTNFQSTPEYKLLVEEHNYTKRYQAMWQIGQPVPYPVTFTTVDAVVVQSGHVLLVQRKTAPGKGLWALPGGFINQNERLEDAAIRELREETKLKVPVPVLKGSVKGRETFDAPTRSLRGRVISHAFLFALEDQPDLPKVKGADDAAKAKWFPLDLVESMGPVLFEDHKSIIQTMVAKLTD